MKRTTLYIQNLKCAGCEASIVDGLNKLNSINNITVDHERHAVIFDYDGPKELELAKRTLSRLGYPSEGEKNPLSKQAKSFVSCAVGRMKK
jgi:copper chaperone CopZ